METSDTERRHSVPTTMERSATEHVQLNLSLLIPPSSIPSRSSSSRSVFLSKTEIKEVTIDTKIWIWETNPQSQKWILTSISLCFSMGMSFIGVTLFNFLSLSSVFMGLIYIREEYCPVEPQLPRVLVISGVLAVALGLLEGRGCYRFVNQKPSVEMSPNNVLPGAVEGAPDFLAESARGKKRDAWFWIQRALRLGKFISISYLFVLILRIYSDLDFDADALILVNKYCNRTLVMFSFGYLVFVFLFLAFLASCYCCVKLSHRYRLYRGEATGPFY